MLMQKMMEDQMEPKPSPQWLLTTPKINKTIPWGYFDGANQGEPLLWGAGGLVYLNEKEKLKITFAPGRVSNNKEELATLWAVLRIDLDK